jgi:TPR repeat protein
VSRWLGIVPIFLIMERGKKKQKSLRTLLRECFGETKLPQKWLEVDIWQLIIVNADLQSVSTMAQTSKAFNQLVEDNYRTNNLKLAKRYLREGQTRMARRCLENCVEHGNPEAMFCIGYAYFSGGWGLKPSNQNMYEYLKMSADAGNPRGMVYYARIYQGNMVLEGGSRSNIYYQRALASGDLFARGYYYYYGANPADTTNSFEAVKCFTKLAMDGDEHAQYFMGDCHLYGKKGVDKNREKAIEWYTKAAEQGFYPALDVLSQMIVGTNSKWARMAHKQRYHE